MKKIVYLVVLSLGMTTVADTPIALSHREASATPVIESLQREAQAATDRAVAWLKSRQHTDGYWSNPAFPALSALALWALLEAGVEDGDAIDRACTFLLSCVREDGGIYVVPTEQRRGGGMGNYNTALSMTALYRTGRSDLIPVVQRARAFVAAGQFLESESLYFGGMGYDASTDRAYADLSNSYIAYEAMRLTQGVEDLRADGERVDLDWQAAVQFVQRIQNLPEFNPLPWVSDAPADLGGFAYHPNETRAGTYADEEGVVRFRSHGSMTYAGLLSFIYAEVDRRDPRVQAAADWAIRHWTLEENPGAGQEGLFYYYNVLTKGLAVFGQHEFIRESGQPLNWRQEVIEQILTTQRVEEASGMGYWLNDNGRYWENDPVLVTAYTLIALQLALGR